MYIPESIYLQNNKFIAKMFIYSKLRKFDNNTNYHFCVLVGSSVQYIMMHPWRI